MTIAPNRITAISALVWGIVNVFEAQGAIPAGVGAAVAGIVEALAQAGVVFGLGRKVERLSEVLSARPKSK